MSEEKQKPVIEKGDKVHIMSQGIIGTFVKVYEAQNIEGEKRSLCSVLVNGKERPVDLYDIELLEKAPKPPKPILVTRSISRAEMARRGWTNNWR